MVKGVLNKSLYMTRAFNIYSSSLGEYSDPRTLDLIRRKNVADKIDGLHCYLEAKMDDIDDGICSIPIFSFSRRSASRIYQFDLAEGPEFESDLKADKPFYTSVYVYFLPKSTRYYPSHVSISGASIYRKLNYCCLSSSRPI
jgi:hypothetical protein